MPVLQWGRVDVWEEVQHSASWLAFWGGGPNKHAHKWFGLQGSTEGVSKEFIEDIRQAVHRRPDAMVTRPLCGQALCEIHSEAHREATAALNRAVSPAEAAGPAGAELSAEEQGAKRMQLADDLGKHDAFSLARLLDAELGVSVFRFVRAPERAPLSQPPLVVAARY